MLSLITSQSAEFRAIYESKLTTIMVNRFLTLFLLAEYPYRVCDDSIENFLITSLFVREPGVDKCTT
jgi:hypothetical protein